MYKYLLFFLLILPKFIFSQDLVINEVMASNQTTILDEDGEASDWIELYNNGTEQIDLTGYSLSDNAAELQKWTFGSASLNPGEYLIVFASDKDTLNEYWHTNFKISASGETIVLTFPGGTIADSVTLPPSEDDISYGRVSDGAAEWIFQSASPGAENTGSIDQYADSVNVTMPSGSYPSAITVGLSAGESAIFYSLDGSDPDSGSTEYTGQITVNNTLVLKAVSFKEDCLPSPVVYRTYLINENTALPVVSLVSDPYNLFDYNYGIYADGPGWTEPEPHWGANYHMDWERPAHIEFFDDDKNPGFSEDCGIAMYGAWTRAFPQKSFAVKFKSEYGKNSINYPLFPDFDLEVFKGFVLRNSGNDFWNTHIRDAMMQTLIEDLDIDYLEYRPAVTFLNGDYWGIYNIREKINEHYVANRHGVDPDNIDMLEGNMEVIHGDNLHYQSLIDYITSNDMSTDEAYNFVDSMIDLEECILYYAAQLYYNNRDWPGNNVKYWRERSETGKWRWIIYDLDFGFNLYESDGQAEDHVSFVFSGIQTDFGNPEWSTLLIRKLVENPKIKTRLINQVADLLNTNFKSSRVVSIIHQMADHIADDIGRHREKWGIGGENVTSRMIPFAEERPGYLRGFIRNFFSCGNDGNITIDGSEGGRVKLNTIYLGNNDFSWTGIYFRNNPVTLKAIPDPGYKFDGWSGAVTSTEEIITVSAGDAVSLYASFSADTATGKEIVINEINYNSLEEMESGDWIELYNQSQDTVDISGWYFSDSEDEHKFYFPEETILLPGAYLVLVENDSAFSFRHPGITNYTGEMSFGLSGSGELIRLIDDEGLIIDSLTYDDNLPWPVEADGNGPTLELVDPLSDNSLGENWQASSGIGTPGRLNSVSTSAEENIAEVPREFLLNENFPNPFNPSTVISYQIPEKGFVTLKIYDILGNEIKTLAQEEKGAGKYHITFNAAGLSSGMYICRINVNTGSGEFSAAKKMVLLK